MLPAPVAATTTLMEIAVDLARGVRRGHREEQTVSGLAISVSHLGHAAPQLEVLFRLKDDGRRPGSRKGMASKRAMDAIHGRFAGRRWAMRRPRRMRRGACRIALQNLAEEL
jgi:DNA polymerase-4